MKEKLRFIFSYVKKHPFIWVIGLLFPPIFTLICRLLYAWANKLVVAKLLIENTTIIDIFVILGALFLGMISAEVMCYFTKCIYNRFSILTNNNVMHDLFDKITGSHIGDILKFNSGEITNRYNRDVETAVSIISKDMYNFMFPLVMGIGYCIAIMVTNFLIGIIVTFLVIIVTWLNILFVKRFRRIEKEKLLLRDDFIKSNNSVLQGKMTIRMMSIQEQMNSFLDQSSMKLKENESHFIHLTLIKAFTSNVFAMICSTMILPFACVLASLNMINLPNVIFIAQLSGTLIGFTSSFGVAVTSIGNHMIGLNRVKELMDLPLENSGTHNDFIDNENWTLELNNLSINYDNKQIISQANMCVHPGEIIALVGASGCGKSSILKTILKIVEYHGDIKLRGRNIEDYELDKLRNMVAYVPENNELIDGTLTYNISLGNSDAKEEQIIRAMQDASLTEFLSQENILDCEVGERGNKLSGGQRQRVSIARAILRDADVILMDEPTASLDSVSEQRFLENIRKIADNGKIAIVVTHRISTIKIADHINMVQNGSLVENISLEEAVRFLKSQKIN
ncbi:ABC transporter ATP-binding protein [Sedimentibacter sp. zth1]|uniref:ABC transporter ATP-binding protein n=1 Tax=Sedimentibacter sp. zth1 TaxID=2816908 RepID=UPI001A9298F2|nr:ABC transporter ATP-binding protein [Sedimentibacter sp. zth1]QSX06094.1 ABC transporter ATP-binding protein [Sedimentibacter sp. zth1]